MYSKILLLFFFLCGLVLSQKDVTARENFNESNGFGIGIKYANPLISLLDENGYFLSLSPQLIYKNRRHQFFAGYLRNERVVNKDYQMFVWNFHEEDRTVYDGFVFGYSYYPFRNVRRVKIYYYTDFSYVATKNKYMEPVIIPVAVDVEEVDFIYDDFPVVQSAKYPSRYYINTTTKRVVNFGVGLNLEVNSHLYVDSEIGIGIGKTQDDMKMPDNMDTIFDIPVNFTVKYLF